jgi:signal transduction histidine kinase
MSSPSDTSPTQDDTGSLNNKIAYLEKELERIKHEQIEYLQNVSHQLVTPLNAIKWHIENLTSARIGADRAKKVLSSV